MTLTVHDTSTRDVPLHEQQEQENGSAPRSRATAGPAPSRTPGSGHRRPTQSRTVLSRTATAVLAGLAAVVVAVVHARGMYVAPIRFDDEGTYVSQAASLLHDGQLAPYTYWYDHPPLGWIVLAGWFALPGITEHAPNLIGAGRQLMLLCDVASVLLVSAIARRAGASRWGAAAAALLLGLSPLALTYHRMVLLDNIAVPLLLGSFLLAMSPQRRLAAFLPSGFLFSAAVLVKETTLLLLPFVLWAVWRAAAGPTRRMALTVFGIGVSTLGVLYPLFALTKGELLAGPDHVSLAEGLVYQLSGRKPSGSVLAAGSDAHAVVHGWLATDPYLVVAGLAAAVVTVALPWRRLSAVRPMAAALVFLAAFLLRPGYLPVPYVVALLPLAALSVAVAGDAAICELASRTGKVGARGHGAWWRRVAGVAAGLVLVATAAAMTGGIRDVAPHWYAKDVSLQHRDADAPYRKATAYVEQALPRRATFVVDNVTWTDLHTGGYPKSRLVWFTKLNTDPDVDRHVRDWHDVDYVVSSDIMRTSREAGRTLRDSLSHSRPIAAWGTGSERIEIRKVSR